MISTPTKMPLTKPLHRKNNQTFPVPDLMTVIQKSLLEQEQVSILEQEQVSKELERERWLEELAKEVKQVQ